MRLSFLLISLCLLSRAQTKAPPAPADYGQWETLVSGSRFGGGSSPDGKWFAYGIDRSNGNNELRLVNIATGTTKVAAFGTQAAFSADSLWAAYSIGYSEAQQDKLRKTRNQSNNKLGLLNLATGEQTTVDGVESFASVLPETSSPSIAIHRRKKIHLQPHRPPTKNRRHRAPL